MSLNALRMCVVLQDCADQLSVLGNIMRPAADTDGSKSHFTVESSPPPDNKLQRDRHFVAYVINGLIVELLESNTYNSLITAVQEEKMKKAQLLDILNREEESRQKVKNLQKQLHNTQKEKTEGCERLKESIVHLRQQVEDMRVRTEWQVEYVNNCAQQQICEGQNINAHNEKELEDEVKTLQEKLEDQQSTNTIMEDFLKRQLTSLQEKKLFWIKRYEKDTEEKEQKLTALQNKRANNLEQLHELSKKCRDMQQVIIEDRTEKERLRIQLEKEQREIDAAIKIQSWWRGTVVRRGLCSPKKSYQAKPKKAKKKKK
ncbi:dynein regulatory complex protein 9 [Triplophysa rosa]|uniref:Dynein regulatory complex protein 9 n=1 Tax=Triplophysa rosa TaxID=992332 RepID=A0A9W7WKC3_TRIRA|nr:dynein regulatory complex protein 9 [Triplophysa rosa]KAI7802909.1 putative IQ domain-containing protein G [Triplophysa rosa]